MNAGSIVDWWGKRNNLGVEDEHESQKAKVNTKFYGKTNKQCLNQRQNYQQFPLQSNKRSLAIIWY